jgi:hypothetical protein
MYNANNLADVVSVDAVNIYTCDPAEITMENPTGKILVKELDPTTVVRESTGTYYIDVSLSTPEYTVAKYYDEWTLKVDSNMPTQTVENEFRIFPQTWYSTPVPVVYDFSFDFQPNKIRKGSKQYIRIRVTPNVPKATDLARYYENIAILGDVKVSMEMKCGPCIPDECDLRLVVEDEPVNYKEKCFGYYLLDTEDLDCGVYAIWFTLCLGGNIYISDKMNFQVFS